LVLGKYYPDTIRYHAQVMSAASGEVLFPGAIYDPVRVRALRRHSLLYLHGHRVGGCNPSLLEAMGAGNPVVAHDNRFNRWVAAEGALYFTDGAGCERALEHYLENPSLLERHGALNRSRATEVFDWSEILASYAELLNAVSSAVTARNDSGWGRRAQWQLDRTT
jgi:glycosyltransferase involved in cell wall biosynthesis